MTRRITCYVIFVTLIRGQALTKDEEKVRDVFKSNITRTDFSNLLQSLIKLNEQRVSVLQKLYRLEDYGVLTEVLRSGDMTTGNGNPNNLFLIVMSKNQNDTSRGKVGFQVVDSVTSLDAENNNVHAKLDFVLDPGVYNYQNIRKEDRLESIFGNVPRVFGQTKIHGFNDRSKKITTTTKTLKYNKLGLRTEVKPDSKVLRTAKTSLKAKTDRKNNKENSRFEIVSNNGRPLDDDGKSNKYPQTVGYYSNEYLEMDFTIKNKKLTTNHILSSSHKNSKYPIEDKGQHDEDDSPFSNIENDRNRQYTQMISDISTKKHHGIDHHNLKNNKYTPKVKVQSNQPTKFNQYKYNLNNQGIKYSKIKKGIETTTRKNYYRINGTVNKASKNNHRIKHSNLNNDYTNANNHDLIYSKIKHIDATKEIDNNNFLTLASENVYGSKPVIPETTKDTEYGSYPGFENHKDVRGNSNKDKPKTAEDTAYGSYAGLEYLKGARNNSNKDKPNTAKELRFHKLNAESKKATDYDGVKMFDNGKRSGEEFSVFITNVGNGTAEEVKQQNDPKLILNAFDQPESKHIARKPFVKCLNKKASKLCCKSCISAYKNVCQRLKCTSRSKKALKKECKRSCKKTFASSSSKYSDENSSDDSGDEYSDESYSDDDFS